MDLKALRCSFLFTALFFTSQAGALPATNLAPIPATVDTITTGELRMHLEFLASDELGGRYTLSPNFAVAARYLASHLRAYGFHGLGKNGDFLQFFDVISSRPNAAKSSLSLTTNGQTMKYGYGDFFVFDSTPGEASGQVVFVGHGISSPAQRHDDYAHVDVKGKIVLTIAGVPAGIDRSKLENREKGEGAARAHGAVAVIQLPSQRRLGLMKSNSFTERFGLRESVQLAKEPEGKL